MLHKQISHGVDVQGNTGDPCLVPALMQEAEARAEFRGHSHRKSLTVSSGRHTDSYILPPPATCKTWLPRHCGGFTDVSVKAAVDNVLVHAVEEP